MTCTRGGREKEGGTDRQIEDREGDRQTDRQIDRGAR